MFGLFGKKGYQYQNTRQFLRLVVTWPIKCEILPEEGDGGQQLARTKDVSAGGVRVELPQAVPVGTHLTVSIMVPDLDQMVTAKSRVVRCLQKGRKFELGIQFLKIDPQEQETLKALIAKRIPEKERNRQLRLRWWRKVT